MRLFPTIILLLALANPGQAAVELLQQQVSQPPTAALLRVTSATLQYDQGGKPYPTLVDQLRCQLEIIAPENAKIAYSLPPKNYGSFAIVDQEPRRRVLVDQGLKTTLVWYLEPQQLGTNLLPAQTITITLNNGEPRQLLIPQTKLTIASSLPTDKSPQDILPPLAPVPPKTWPWQPWAAGGGILIMVGTGLIWLWRHRHRPQPEPTPRQRGLTMLAQLQQSPAPQASEAEALSALLREYLDWCCQTHYLGQTVAELTEALANTPLPPKEQKYINDILAQCEKWQFSTAPIEPERFQQLLELSKKILTPPPQQAEDDKTCGRW